MTDAGADLARAFSRRLAAFEEGPLRAGAAARALAGLAPAEAVALAGALARDAAAEARAALLALGRVLAAPPPELGYDWLAEVYATAAAAGLTEVTAPLVSPPPLRAWEEPFDKADARLASLTLGHKKSLARAHRDPDLLARLAAEGEPTVVRELLANPQLSEDFVVRIAARRPCRPGTLRCVFEARRWRTRPRVAQALARNPYAETEVALGVLPLLGAADLAEVGRDGTVHPLVRAVAARLARERRSGSA